MTESNREVNSSRERSLEEWEELAEGYSFDELARGLASGTISRGQALKLVGAGILGGALITLWPNEAQALSFRRRCRRRGGTVCRTPTGSRVCCPRTTVCSNGRCIRTCNNFDALTTCVTTAPNQCAQNSNCRCFPTTEGGSFCVDTTSLAFNCNNTQCTSTANCPAGSTCIKGGPAANCCPTNICVRAAASCS